MGQVFSDSGFSFYLDYIVLNQKFSLNSVVMITISGGKVTLQTSGFFFLFFFSIVLIRLPRYFTLLALLSEVLLCCTKSILKLDLLSVLAK